ncbi:Bug family tripartite tricarboxylate transporter substrate binding protein [Rhodoferax ferrireducens]|uniref:Bug family tripartite tricarboxylate transporter substrate binding protein n=1 Tax=Rhodoferax ferrireducens TaxID=192843 RepID=UPI001300B494|nr:tripartite tricarboxylate transporter substrate binding protein [Rhodoferax ferrireducens]
MKKVLHKAACIAVALGGLAIAVLGHAQTYPTKLVTLRVAYPAGGPADVATRKIQSQIQAGLGQTVIIENLPGAGGSIAARSVLSAPPDGHVVLVTTGNDAILAPLAMTNAKYRSDALRLVANIFPTDLALVTAARHSFKGVDDFVNAARTKKDYSIGSWGYGSITYLAGADFQARADIKLLDVPYKGAAPVVQALLTQEIDAAFVPMAASVIALINSGQIKLIGTASAKRNPYLPKAPTLNEGKYVRDFFYSAWAGVFVSTQVPESAALKLNAQINEAVKTATFQEFIKESAGLPVDEMSLAQADGFYKSEREKYEKVAKSINLTPK